MFTLSKAPQSIGNVLLNGFTLYKQAFTKVFLLAVLYAVMIIFPNVLLHHEFIDRVRDFNAEHVVFMSILLICNLISLWLVAVIVHQIYGIMHKQKPSIARSLFVATYKFPIYLITTILYMLFVFIGTVIFILPGVFLTVLFSFTLFFILFENAGIEESFEKSAALVWKHWWRTVAVLLVPAIAISALPMIVEHVVDLPIIHLSRFPRSEISFVSHIVAAVLIIFLYPWFMTTLVCLYHDLKLRKQSTV